MLTLHTVLPCPVIFLWKYVRIFCTAAKDSHTFPTKNTSVFVILTFKSLTKRFTNDIDNF